MLAGHICGELSTIQCWHVSVQLYVVCPQVLLPVLPHVGNELHMDAEANRLAAVDLLGRLFALPGSDMDAKYPELFTCLLLRCKDQKVRSEHYILWSPCPPACSPTFGGAKMVLSHTAGCLQGICSRRVASQAGDGRFYAMQCCIMCQPVLTRPL